MKYRPEYPAKAFDNLVHAQDWVNAFVCWYNTQHLHIAVRFVTPDDRHYGRQHSILVNRRFVYEKARRRNPNRWSRQTRNWNPVHRVLLNPAKEKAGQEYPFKKQLNCGSGDIYLDTRRLR